MVADVDAVPEKEDVVGFYLLSLSSAAVAVAPAFLACLAAMTAATDVDAVLSSGFYCFCAAAVVDSNSSLAKHQYHNANNTGAAKAAPCFHV